MKISGLAADDVYRRLVTAPSGLSEAEAARRLAEFGPNEIREVRRVPLYRRFLGQFTHFLAVILWMAAAMSFLSEYLHPGEGMRTLGLAIIAVIVINAVFTFIQEYRAEKALGELRKLLPFHVRVMREGVERSMAARGVVPGDLILVTEGDKVPADARLVHTSGLRVNNAPLTGESDPVPRTHGPSAADLPESPNIAFAGTAVVSGSGTAVVFATGMRTEFGRIAHLTSAVEPGLSPLQKEIVKATRVVAAIAGGVGAFFFLLGFVTGRAFWDNFLFGVGITVALIPEGMLPTVTLALAMGSQRMARRKALVRTLTSVETLGSVTVICTDKTGTLTQNRMAVTAAWTRAGFSAPPEIASEQLVDLMQAAAHCNNARVVEGEYRGDPTETALLKAARQCPLGQAWERVLELPFDPERKRMTTLHNTVSRQIAFTKGALEGMLPLCSSILDKGRPLPMDDAERAGVMEAYHALMDKGLRVLAFASRYVNGDSAVAAADLERDLTLIGLIGLEDPPRPEVPEALRRCRNAGIRVVMITGDASRTAIAIAREIGLVTGSPAVVEGNLFNRMSDGELRAALLQREVIFTRMTPKHKMRVVSILKQEGEVVAVTGDGVNDAPALKMADIGIAMGITGTDVAKEAADMVLLDDNFATIVNAVEEGRTVFENIRKFITYIFASNIPEAVPYLSYILFRIPLPLTIIQILAVDLGTDMLPALALGAERPTPGVMQRSPRSTKERLLSFPILSRAYLFLGPMEAAACMFGFFWVLEGGGWSLGEMPLATDPLYLRATTACLTAIVVSQVGNVFACRSSHESVFRLGLFSNRLIFVGIAVELLLQCFIVYHPLGNRIFSTAPLPPSTWLVLVPFAVVVLLAEEARKWWVRRAAAGGGGGHRM